MRSNLKRNFLNSLRKTPDDLTKKGANVEKRIVIFSGIEQDEYGMPALIHYYVIFAKTYKQDDKYVVVTKIVGSEGRPDKTVGLELIKAQSEEEAINITIEKLKKYPSNSGLTLHVSDIPGIKL